MVQRSDYRNVLGERPARAFLRGIAALLILAVFQVALAQITITRTSYDDSIFIGKQEARARGMYVSYKITNSGADLPDVWVKLDTFTGGIVSLAQDGATLLEDGIMHLGALGAGSSKTAFFYLSATATSKTDQSHQVSLYDRRPDITGATLLDVPEVFTYGGNADYDPVNDAIEANPNKIQPETFVVGPNPPELGGIVTITFQGTTGTIGSNGGLLFTPAAFLDWDADALELFETTVVLDEPGCTELTPPCNDGTFVNDLAIEFASGELPNTTATAYTATYSFRAIGTTATPTAISTIAYITSGNDFKHTATGDLASIAPILSPVNRLTLRKSVDQNGLPLEGPGETETVTYTLTLDNDPPATVTAASSVEVFKDTLPTGATYSPGSSLYNGDPIADPVVDGGSNTLIWSGTFAVAANGSSTLSYQVDLPTDVPVTHTNSAIAEIGSVQIDSTVATGDDVPASVNVFVPPAALADLSVTKTPSTAALPPGGGTLTYTITVANAGPSPADAALLADSVPADLLTPEYSTDGGGSWLPWTGTLGLGTLAGGASQEVLIRGSVNPAFSGTLSNTATVSSSTSDPSLSNNTSEPAITNVGLALRISKSTSTPSVVNPPTGTQATYTITATNDTGAPTAEGVYLTDVLPSGFSYDGGTAPTIVLSGGTTRDLIIDPVDGALTPAWGTFTIPADGSVAITFVADIASSVADGSYDNSAGVSSSTPGILTDDFDGAVESSDDVTVSAPPTIDYGDAPDSYGTLSASGGASHALDPNLYLGAVAPDVDVDGFSDGTDDAPTGDAADDDNEGVDDEDGVGAFPSLAIEATGYTLPAANISLTNATGSAATLYGFIDFNADGDFDDPGESASVNVGAGATSPDADLAWTGFTMTATPGTSYARFRLSSDVGLGPAGVAADGEVEDYQVTIEASDSVLSGTLFYDDGLSAGTPHDALQNGGELGVSGVLVTASDGTSSISVLTDANGDYSLFIPDTFGSDVTVSHTLQPATGTSIAGATNPACLAAGFNDAGAAQQLIGDLDCSGAIDGAETGFAAGQTYSDYDFGVVRASTLISDRVGQVASPGTIDYDHLFTPGTLGAVTLSLGGDSFGYQVFVDESCDGSYGAGEGPHAFPYAFTVDGTWPRLPDGSLQTCNLRVRVIVPDGVADGQTDIADITADLVWSGNPVSDTALVIDTTTISSGGQLQLTKEVCNVTQGCSYGPSAVGKPGEVLEYRIRFQNLGTDDVTDIQFSDPVPFFTTIVLDQYGGTGEVEVICPDTSTVTLDSGAVTIVAVDISSECSISAVAAGESGTVRYRVTID